MKTRICRFNTSRAWRLKQEIARLVPADFAWWFEIDGDIGYAVRFRWLGMPGVMNIGVVWDADYSIMCRLLEGRDWDAERRLALESVDAGEASKLVALQEVRRANLLRASRCEGVGVQVATRARSVHAAARSALPAGTDGRAIDVDSGSEGARGSEDRGAKVAEPAPSKAAPSR